MSESGYSVNPDKGGHVICGMVFSLLCVVGQEVRNSILATEVSLLPQETSAVMMPSASSTQ